MKKKKDFTVKITKNINYRQIFDLYRETGWIGTDEKFNKASYKKLVDNSFCFAVVYIYGNIIGMGRAISDGISDAYIQDVAVSRQFRGQGIGRKIIDVILNHLIKKKIKWIALIAEPGTEAFYRKINFNIMKDFTPMKFRINK